MATRIAAYGAAALMALALAPVLAPSAAQAGDSNRQVLDNGIVRVRSLHPFDETVALVGRDIAARGMTVFVSVDQTKLAAEAGIALGPSRLLVFGSPALGLRFVAANPDAGLDWPVRLLVSQDGQGQVWAVYDDVRAIARRHGLADPDEASGQAADLMASIALSVSR